MTKCSTKGCKSASKVKGLCKKHYSAAWHKAHPEATANWHKSKPEATARWHKANPYASATWHKANPEACAGWKKANPGKVNAYISKRRALTLQRTPAWADQNKIKQLYETAASVTKSTGIPHEVDHIIPLQGELVSGLHVEYNLQVLTEKENIKKHNKFKVI